MKKLIVAASMLAACFGAYAQDYKPVAGDVTAELGLFSGDFVNLPNSGFGTPQLKFRYFLQDQMALRVGLNITKTTDTERIYEGAPGTGEGFARTSNSLVGLNLGVEKHFAGTERLSTYAGADLMVQFTGASEKWENTADGTNFADGENTTIKGTNADGNSSFGIGARIIAGADYYFVEKVYLGGEFGWGFTAVKNGKVKSEVTSGGTTVSNETKSTGGSFELAPNLTAGVRIGFRF